VEGSAGRGCGLCVRVRGRHLLFYLQRHLPQSGLWELLTPRLEGGTPTRTYTQAPPPQPAQGLPVVRSQGTRIPLWVIGDGDNAALLLLLLDTTRGKEGMGGNSGREG